MKTIGKFLQQVAAIAALFSFIGIIAAADSLNENWMVIIPPVGGLIGCGVLYLLGDWLENQAKNNTTK
jgi:membrane protein DedA with SNARE-associated domain